MSFGDLAKALILPPIGLLLVALVGLLLGLRWRRLGWGLSMASVLGLLALALPVTGGLLLAALETGLPRTPAPDRLPKAIVILSAEARPIDEDGTRCQGS